MKLHIAYNSVSIVTRGRVIGFWFLTGTEMFHLHCVQTGSQAH